MTSRSSQAFCTLAPTGVAPIPSIVVTARSRTAPTGSMQERTGLPSIGLHLVAIEGLPEPDVKNARHDRVDAILWMLVRHDLAFIEREWRSHTATGEPFELEQRF